LNRQRQLAARGWVKKTAYSRLTTVHDTFGRWKVWFTEPDRKMKNGWNLIVDLQVSFFR
jgi:hypothetical protein